MIGELALHRWPTTKLTDGSVTRHIRFGGVLDGADLFHKALFSVSVAEASAMDPQQRQLLESGHQALHAAAMGALRDGSIHRTRKHAGTLPATDRTRHPPPA